MSDGQDVCEVTGKIIYRNRSQAKRAVKQIETRMRQRRQRSSGGFAVYWCETYEHFHIAHASSTTRKGRLR